MQPDTATIQRPPEGYVLLVASNGASVAVAEAALTDGVAIETILAELNAPPVLRVRRFGSTSKEGE